ncbi:serine protease [Sulfitobacter sp. S190]|uniref:serine protease n=1 Tax=Sulfitobacter sp. S190 TaxID=2867022 RepID=UPI0021A81E7D|nr:serine protease [Sulfitobacter sp. S190]UWR21405.1 trypsin-like peptidase domain-containing protein [Sulfitobacter sp. S190]
MIRSLLAVPAALCLLLLTWSSTALAQQGNPDDVVWVQVEAQPSLTRATDRARAYAAQLDDVNGFAVGGGWYAIVVGPYRRADAELVLRSYRRDRIIPRDSFIQLSSRLRQQFWPVGANVLGNGAVAAPESTLPATAPEAPVTDTPVEPLAQDTETPAAPAPADETPQQARQSERLLDGDGRKALQIALKWAGFYTAGIDGSFGRGTRNSMAAWQEANGFEVTGILTTQQRAVLLQQYNAVLDGMDLQIVTDTQAGIEMLVPLGVVAFDRYEPPFAQYNSTGDVPAQVLLISQPGDRATLAGLYEIMQTLEIVPLEGPRERKRDSFTLVGEDARQISYTEVTLQNGEIKGFTLIWPTGDEERRRRVLGEMRSSFTRIDGVLSPSAGVAGTQSIDLVAGLQIRKPKLSRSGFFITARGDVATTAQAVQSCSRITLDTDTEAMVIAQDAASGIALLKPSAALAPLAVAQLTAQEPRLQSEVAAAGYSFEGVLSAPSMTFGTLADVRGLDGEDTLKRLSLKARDGDAGGPVLDQSGQVIGMMMPRDGGEGVLPEDVSFARDAASVVAASAEAGLTLPASQITPAGLTPFQIAQRATGMTVLVSCWD